MPLIQITNTYQGDVLRIVEDCVPEGFEARTLTANTSDALLSVVADADYILASGRVKIDREVLRQAKHLKMIQRTGVGLDSLDLDAIREAGVPLYVNKGVNSQSVAEHTILLILAGLRKLTLIDRNSKNGIWKSKEQAIQTRELCGKTVGIVGLGSIGRRVAELLHAFGAHVIYSGSSKKDVENAEFVSLEELLQRSDIITLHCPMTDTTREMINRDSLSMMKDGVIIVNTARGGLIREEDLLDAINSGKVGFAGLDVHAEEPFKADALICSDHVIATPHIAGVTYDAFHKMMSDAMRNIRLFEMGHLEEIEPYRLV